MAFIKLSNVYLDYPIYSDVSKSFKKVFLDKITGGNIIKHGGLYHVESLKSINLNLVSGDRLGVIGSNGSGKTSLLRLISGILSPREGQIEINGSINPFIDINYGMNLEATGVENIKMRLILFGISVNELNQKIEDISVFSELGKYLYMPVKTYSSGMIMRLSFSIMASIKSDIIIIDEWLSVGDEEFKEKANDKMKDLINSSSILIIASHEQDLIKKWCNKQIKLHHGEIIN